MKLLQLLWFILLPCLWVLFVWFALAYLSNDYSIYFVDWDYRFSMVWFWFIPAIFLIMGLFSTLPTDDTN